MSSLIKTVREAGSKHKLLFGVFGVLLIIVIFIAYQNVYVSHRVNTILNENGFTDEKGYKVEHQGSKKVQLIANQFAFRKIGREAQVENFDPSKELPTEKQLLKSVNEISKIPLAGNWEITLVTKDPRSNSKKKMLTYWAFKGKHETAKLQDTDLYSYWRVSYEDNQKMKAQQQENANDFGTALKAFGAFLGGAAVTE